MAEQSKIPVRTEHVDAAFAARWDRILIQRVAPEFVDLMQEGRVGASAVVSSAEVLEKAKTALEDLRLLVARKQPRSECVPLAARLGACAIALLFVWDTGSSDVDPIALAKEHKIPG